MRKHYLDNIRWITVLLVALYHVIFLYAGVVHELNVGPFRDFQLQDSLLYFVYPWFMILLFVVSGISSRLYLQNHSVKEFVGSRTRKLLVPSTIGLVVFQWILGYFSMSLNGAFQTMPVDTMPKPMLFLIMALSGIGPLWYIQALWVFSMVLALVRRWEKKERLYSFCENLGLIPCLLLMIPLWVSAQLLNTPVITVYRMGVYGFSFLLGYFVLAHDRVVEGLSRYWKLLAGAALVLGLAYTVFYFGEPYCADPIVSNPFSIGYAWIMVLAILAFMYKLGSWDNGFTRFMNRESFGIYVFHYLGLSIAAYLIGNPQTLPAWLSYPIAGISSLLGSIVLYEVISRIPVIRWCVLGMRKEKKHVQ